MRVMIANDNPFAHYYIRVGLAKVLSMMGHDVVIWDINHKSTFDAFDEFNPDFFIGQTYNINRGWIKCIKERPHLRVIMKAADWGPFNDTLDRKRYPVLIASEQEKENVRTLRELTGKPDFVYVHYHEKRLLDTHGHWLNKMSIPIHSMMNAADILTYSKGVKKPEYESDMVFVGGRWGYKSVVFNKWFIPLLSSDYNYNVKIFGNQPWGVPQYCGFLSDSEVPHAFASAKVCPNLSEPHSQDFGYDVIERPFKLLANKCCVLSDYVEDMEMLFPNGEIFFAHNPQQFKEKLDYLLNHEDERVEAGEKGYTEVIKNHTYFNRIKAIMTRLGLDDEVIKCDKAFEEAKRKLSL